MKLYYDGVGYPCKWKSLMKKDMWYSLEPAKLRVTLPKSVYKKILNDIKIDEENKTLLDTFNFKVYKSKNDKLYFKESIDGDIEAWEVKSYLNTSIISSEFRNGLVTVHLDILIYQPSLLPKDESRNIILSELLTKSENQE